MAVAVLEVFALAIHHPADPLPERIRQLPFVLGQRYQAQIEPPIAARPSPTFARSRHGTGPVDGSDTDVIARTVAIASPCVGLSPVPAPRTSPGSRKARRAIRARRPPLGFRHRTVAGPIEPSEEAAKPYTPTAGENPGAPLPCTGHECRTNVLPPRIAPRVAELVIWKETPLFEYYARAGASSGAWARVGQAGRCKRRWK